MIAKAKKKISKTGKEKPVSEAVQSGASNDTIIGGFSQVELDEFVLKGKDPLFQ